MLAWRGTRCERAPVKVPRCHCTVGRPSTMLNITELHSQGYTVIKSLMGHAETGILLRAVTAHVDDRGAEPIFNYNTETARNDRRRRQVNMPAALSRGLAERLDTLDFLAEFFLALREPDRDVVGDFAVRRVGVEEDATVLG